MKLDPLFHGFTFYRSCEVPLKLISKSNEKTAGRFLSPKFRAFENSVALLAQTVFGKLELSEAWIGIEPEFKTKKHCDLNNASKSVMDALVKGRVLRDDKYIAVTILPATYGHHRDQFNLSLWKKNG